MTETKHSVSPEVNEEERKSSILAQEAFRKQDWDAAELFCNKAIRAAPDNPRHYMFRGWIHAGRSRNVRARRYYIEVLEGIASDYEKAHQLAPDDPQIMVSLIEVRICQGKAADAAQLASALWSSTRDQPWKGLCAWLGSIACALVDHVHDLKSEFTANCALAAASILAGAWNTAEIEKYLNDYAEEDFPTEKVAEASLAHAAVQAAVHDLRKKTPRAGSAEAALMQLLESAALTLADDDRVLSKGDQQALERALADVKHGQAEGAGMSADHLGAVIRTYQQILLAQGIKLASKAAQHAKNGSKEAAQETYVDALYCLEAAAKVDPADARTTENVPVGFVNFAGFLAVELADCGGARQVLQRGLALYPENESLKTQMRQIEYLEQSQSCKYDPSLAKASSGAGMVYTPDMTLQRMRSDLGYSSAGNSLPYSSPYGSTDGGLVGPLCIGCLISGCVGLASLITGLSLGVTFLTVVGVLGFMGLGLCAWLLTQVV